MPGSNDYEVEDENHTSDDSDHDLNHDDSPDDSGDDSSDDSGNDSSDDSGNDSSDDSGNDSPGDSGNDSPGDSGNDSPGDSGNDSPGDSGNDSSNDSGDDSSDDFGADARAEYDTSSREKYAFTIENGVVTGFAELEHGVVQPDSMDSDETYALDGADVLKFGSEDFGQTITRYTDEDGDGLYMRVSEQWVAGDGTLSAPMPEIHDPLEYFGSSDDDYIGLVSDDASTGGAGADQFVFRQLGHMSIADFKHEDGDKIVFDTGLGLQSLEQIASLVTAINYDGHDIEIEFGDMVSLTLVGCNPADFSGQEFVVLS